MRITSKQFKFRQAVVTLVQRDESTYLASMMRRQHFVKAVIPSELVNIVFSDRHQLAKERELYIYNADKLIKDAQYQIYKQLQDKFNEQRN